MAGGDCLARALLASRTPPLPRAGLVVVRGVSFLGSVNLPIESRSERMQSGRCVFRPGGIHMKIVLFALCGAALLSPSASANTAGSIFLTGHDPDFHAQAQSGSANLLKRGMEFARNGNPARFLFVL